MAVEGGNSKPTNRPDAIDAYMIDWYGTPRQHEANQQAVHKYTQNSSQKGGVGWGEDANRISSNRTTREDVGIGPMR